MWFSVLLISVFAYLSYRAAPRERHEDALVHGAGQIGLLAAVALFGMDYFTSYFYATGEMMHALHPYGLQKYGYIAAAVISLANFTFGALYMYSLGIFNEGGGSYTASMRYLKPTLSLIVAVTLIEDYVFTIVVSSLSGGDQLLSLIPQFYEYWWLHFLVGAVLLDQWNESGRERASHQWANFVVAEMGVGFHHGVQRCVRYLSNVFQVDIRDEIAQTQQHVVHRSLQRSLVNPASHGGVSLRIEVYQQYALFHGCQTGRQIHCRSCFSYSALLVGYCKYLDHSYVVFSMTRQR